MNVDNSTEEGALGDTEGSHSLEKQLVDKVKSFGEEQITALFSFLQKTVTESILGCDQCITSVNTEKRDRLVKHRDQIIVRREKLKQQQDELLAGEANFQQKQNELNHLNCTSSL